MKYIYKLSFLFLLIPAIVIASNNSGKKHERDRKVSKTFEVDKDASLTIKNKYGTINVTSWNKNTVQIDVKITVKGNDLDKVEEKLKEVTIDFTSNSNLVEAITRFGNSNRGWNSWWGKSNKINYQIDYTIKMPITNDANLSNDYGSIYLDKLKGNVSINCDYGKVVVGDLMGNNSNINLDYTKNSSIKSMKNGSINTDYSSLTIDNSEDVKVNSDYSTLKFGKASTVTFNSDYGSISAEDVKDFSGNGDYTGIKVGVLRNNFKVSSDYGRIRIGELAKGFESVSIDSEYASIKIGVPDGVGFDFKIDLQYASFSKGNSEIFKSIEKNSKKYYEGKYNKGGSATVEIKSEFGGVSFYEN